MGLGTLTPKPAKGRIPVAVGEVQPVVPCRWLLPRQQVAALVPAMGSPEPCLRLALLRRVPGCHCLRGRAKGSALGRAAGPAPL